MATEGGTAGIFRHHSNMLVIHAQRAQIEQIRLIVSQRLPFLIIGAANLLEQLYECHSNDSLTDNNT